MGAVRWQRIINTAKVMEHSLWAGWQEGVAASRQ